MLGMNTALHTPAPHVQTVVVLTSGTSWTPPAGITNLLLVECWGPGGAGWLGGGGGGAYASQPNIACTPGTAIPMSIGTGGVVSVGAGASPANDGSGPTWFKSTTTVKADYGRGGGDTPNTEAGWSGVPGLASNSAGTTVFSGGAGAFGQFGGAVSGFNNAGGGGGGAAGPNGAGVAGTTNIVLPAGSAQNGNGGAGNNGLGGAGGLGNTSAGPTPASDGAPGGSNVNGGGGGASSSWEDGQDNSLGGIAGLGGSPGGGGGGAYALAVGGGGGQIRITF
jgi:hypothetical protein